MNFMAAAQAGISSIPVNTKTKAALVTWAEYQEHIADHDELIEWSRWDCGIAAVCGEVSGRLVAIDIEGGFRDRLPELAQRLRAAGLFELFETWVQGYTETTPRGGLHVLVHVGGDGRVERNAKLAMAADNTTVLIETRGEGGYVIIAPSRNGSKGWELVSGDLGSIAWATADEWAAVQVVLASFDESSRVPPAPPAAPVTPAILRLGESWIDEELARLPMPADILAANGWTQARSADSYGQHWVRPDKDPREGHSASISHESGRAYIHSTAAGLPVGVSMDAVDLLFALDHHRMPTLTERTEYLRALRPRVPGIADGAAGQAAEAGPASTSLNLPDEFWQSAEWLRTLRAAARGRMLSPDAVLGALLSTYAAMTPMGIWLPAVVGHRAPLNLYCCLVGRSGTGKSTAMGAAAELVGPCPNPDILLGRSLRSGEGLPRLAIKPKPRRQPKSESVPVDDTPSYRNAVQITFDEGGTLGKQAERSGATVIPYLNQAWSGSGMVGGAKAGEDAYFPADLVRVCAIIGVQFGAAGNLFTGESAALGFPQRLTFFGMRDPELAEMDVGEMNLAPIPRLDLPYRHVSDYTRAPLYLDVDAAVVHEVRTWTRGMMHGDVVIEPLDGHRMLNRLRVSAILALAEGSEAITPRYWGLGRHIDDTSRRIRQHLLASLGDVVKERAKAAGRADLWREEAKSDAWVQPRVSRLVRRCKLFEDGASRKELKGGFAASERKRFDEILDVALTLGWVIHRDGRFWAAGGN